MSLEWFNEVKCSKPSILGLEEAFSRDSTKLFICLIPDVSLLHYSWILVIFGVGHDVRLPQGLVLISLIIVCKIVASIFSRDLTKRAGSTVTINSLCLSERSCFVCEADYN